MIWDQIPMHVYHRMRSIHRMSMMLMVHIIANIRRMICRMIIPITMRMAMSLVDVEEEEVDLVADAVMEVEVVGEDAVDEVQENEKRKMISWKKRLKEILVVVVVKAAKEGVVDAQRDNIIRGEDQRAPMVISLQMVVVDATIDDRELKKPNHGNKERFGLPKDPEIPIQKSPPILVII